MMMEDGGEAGSGGVAVPTLRFGAGQILEKTNVYMFGTTADDLSVNSYELWQQLANQMEDVIKPRLSTHDVGVTKVQMKIHDVRVIGLNPNTNLIMMPNPP